MEQRCDYVYEDGSVCGRPCNELAEWEALQSAEDEDDADHFVACSAHLAAMLEPDPVYLIHSVNAVLTVDGDIHGK